ncbi:MAG: HEAT repeat domain-containing protein, partial [Thermodesulfovibrionaceae bacterium]
DCLKDKDQEIRKTAIVALGEAYVCSDILFDCLQDKDPWIRYYTVKSIHKACNTEILKEKLIPLLEDPFPPVVIATLEALSEVASEIYDIIISKKNHPEKAVREKIEEVLSKI